MCTKSLLAAALYSLCAAAVMDAQAIRQELLPGNAAGNTIVGSLRELDTSSGQVPLGFTINFFGAQESALYVNTHGNVTFGAARPNNFKPEVLQGRTDARIIASYFADHDPERGSRPISFGRGRVGGRPAFFVNYVNLGYYVEPVSTAAPSKTVSHQLVLIDRSDTGTGNFDIEFNYGSMQWEASGPSPSSSQNSQNGQNGVCISSACISAAVGWSNGLAGGNQSFELPGSRVRNSFMDSSAQPLNRRTLNSDLPGRLIFHARNGSIGPFQLTQLVPNSSPARTQDLILEARGSGFQQGAKVLWALANGATVLNRLQTTFISETSLRAVIPGTFLTGPGTAYVSVENGCYMPAVTESNCPVSNSLPFTITQTLRITALEPNNAPAGLPQQALVVRGEGFVPGVQVRWTAPASPPQVLATQFFSTTEVRTTLQANQLITALTASVDVILPATSETPLVTSNVLPFTVTTPLTILSLTPESRPVNSGDFQLTINGTGFASGVQVLFGGATLTPSSVSATQIRVTVPNSAISAAGPVAVRVRAGALTSNTVNFNVSSAATISSISPDSRPVGSGSFDLTINGSGFVTGAEVLFGSTAVTPQAVANTRIVAAIPASLLATPGVIPVRVRIPGNIQSPSVNFTVSGALNISSLSPASRPANSGGFQLSINGTGFVAGVQVAFDDTMLSPLTRTDTRITVDIPANLVMNPGNVSVSVSLPAGVQSPRVTFAVTTLTLSSISPTTIPANSGDFQLTLTGMGFGSGSQVLFGSTLLTSATASETQLTVTVPGNLIQTSMQIPVRVQVPGNAQSAPQQFTVNVNPVIRSIDPTSARAGSGPLTLTVNGINFRPESVVRWNGQSLPTRFISATNMTATVPAERLATPGSAQVIVAAPESAPMTFTITMPAIPPPSLTGIAPNVEPAQNSSVSVSLAQPAPLPIKGRVQLSFQPNANGVVSGYKDPALSFVSGGPAIEFDIAMGQSAAAVQGNGALNVGSVAGVITLAMDQLTAGGQNVLPSSPPRATITVPRRAPSIVAGSVKIVPQSSGFAVELIGHSSPREISQALFTFAPAPGVDMDAGSVTLSSEIAAQFASYFDSSDGRSAGSTFKLTVPFTLAEGSLNDIQSVSVVLRNSVEASLAATGTK